MWSIERSVRKWLAARPACPAPMTTVVVRSMARTSDHLDGDVRRVGERVETGRTLLRLGAQCVDFLLRGIRIDLERDLDVVETVADVAVRAEDPADVVITFHRRLDGAHL